jgi:hypothetical protein
LGEEGTSNEVLFAAGQTVDVCVVLGELGREEKVEVGSARTVVVVVSMGLRR